MAQTQNDVKGDTRAASDKLRSDIRHTRRDMDETLDELSDRLHPRRLLDELLDVLLPSEGSAKRSGAQASTMVKKAGKSVSRYVRENPVPTALMAAGVAWAVYDAAKDDEEEWDDYGAESPPSPTSSTTGDTLAAARSGSDADDEPSTLEKANSGLSSAADSAAGAASAAVGSMTSGISAVQGAGSRTWRRTKRAGRRGYRATGDMSQTAGEYLNAGMERASEGAQTAKARFDEASDEYPLAVAGGFIAAGLLAGLLLPRTKKEDEWMGEASDEVWDTAKAQGEELLEEGTRKAEEAASTAMKEVESQGLAPQQMVDKVKRVASKVGEAAKDATKEEGVDPKSMKAKTQQVVAATKQAAKDQVTSTPQQS